VWDWIIFAAVLVLIVGPWVYDKYHYPNVPRATYDPEEMFGVKRDKFLD
jgi:hypothetical protein